MPYILTRTPNMQASITRAIYGLGWSLANVLLVSEGGMGSLYIPMNEMIGLRFAARAESV